MYEDQELVDADGASARPKRRPSAKVRPRPGEVRKPAGAGPNTAKPARRTPRAAASCSCAASPSPALALALAAGGYYGHYWWTAGRYLVSTDDAYVGAKNATLSPKVSGYIALVAVEDNARVAAGDVIARIDDGDYRLAVQTARDQIAVQQATIERLGRQTAAQAAAVDQAKAQLASAKAGATRADLELKRQQDLATRQINSKQSLEQAQANYDQAVASVQSAEAAIEVGGGQRRRAEGAAGGGAAHAAAIRDDARQGRARSLLHRDPRAVRRRHRQPRRAGRRLRAADAAAGEPGAARRHLRRRQLQGDAARQAAAGPAGDAIASTPSPAARSRAAWRASRRPRAPCSRCCRPTTPPATSPRSCSACRCASWCRPTSPSSPCCGRACRWW